MVGSASDKNLDVMFAKHSSLYGANGPNVDTIISIMAYSAPTTHKSNPIYSQIIDCSEIVFVF